MAFNEIRLAQNISTQNISKDHIDTVNSWQSYFDLPTKHERNPNVNLMSHQVEHAKFLLNVLNKRYITADTSEAGNGKTYVAAWIASKLNLPLFILCPKSVITPWYNISKEFGNRISTVTNYEMVRGSDTSLDVKWYDMRYDITSTISVCPWISKIKYKDNVSYRWNLPYKSLIIFDEEHVGKNTGTLSNSLIEGAVEAARKYGHKILIITATPIEKNTNLKSILYFLGVIPMPSMVYVNKYKDDIIKSRDIKFLHDKLYDGENGIVASMPEFKPINVYNYVDDITFHLNDLEQQLCLMDNETINRLKQDIDDSSNSLGEMTKTQQISEYYILPKLADIVVNNTSKRICVFLNFVHSVNTFIKYLIEKGVDIDSIGTIYTNQTRDTVQSTIDKYNKGDIKYLIATISKAGKSISLHDRIGTLKTHVYIFPPTSATDLMQTMKRHYRAGIKSDVKHTIIYVNGCKIQDVQKDNLELKMNEISNFTLGKNHI